MRIASYIDHTLLKPVANRADIAQLCNEALDTGFAAVCVPPFYVHQAAEMMTGSDVQIATVIGFPFGYTTTEAKLKEIDIALNDGADELDMVHNLANLKNGNWHYLENEIAACLRLIHGAGKKLKVIVESGLLTEGELIRCCQLYGKLGVDFVKTSTGYAETHATLHAVRLMRVNLPKHIGIKASGGIRDYATAKNFIDAGATRIGTSAGMAIVAGEAQH